MTYTVNHNPAFGSLEIRFDSMPTPAVRAAMKTMRFRWHGVNRYWYGKADENTVRETLDKLISRADKISAANHKRGPVAPTPKTPRPVYTPAAALKVISTVEPDPETVVHADTERTVAESAKPSALAFPARENLTALSFSYRIGNSVGQASFSPELLTAASASTLKVILPMLDGIEDAEIRKHAFFTLAALAWYDAKENPERKPRFRQLADLYSEKTGETFPAPETDEKPAASKTVTAACKRMYK